MGRSAKKILEFCKNNRLICAIFLFGILTRLILFLFIRPWDAQVLEDKILINDAHEYHCLALGILKSGTYDTFGTYRMPGFPTLVAFIYFVFGIRPWVVLLFQILLNTISGALIYRIGEKLFDKKVANIATFLFFIGPHTMLVSFKLLADTMLATLFIAAIYFFILGLEGDNMLYLLISPLILGIATLTKSIVLFFPIIISILIYCYNRYRLRKKIFFILEYLMIFLITLSPWAYRNYENYGYFKLDTMGEDLLLSWNATLTEVIRTNQPLTESSFVAIRHKFGREVEQNVKNKSSNPFYISEVQKKIAFRYIKDNFRDFIKCHLKGIGNIYIGIGGVGTSDIFSILRLRHIKLPEDSLTSVFRRIKFALQSWPFYMLILSALIYGYLCIIYVIFLIGFYLLLRRKQYFFFFMVLLAVIYFSIPVGIIGNYRYKLPLVPFFSLLGATAIRTIVCVIKRQYST